jgi:protein tyrosine/serine phosphatase
MDHVYWVTPTLAGRCGPRTHEWDLAALYAAGFRVIISLDNDIDEKEIKAHQFKHIPLYLPDVALSTPALTEKFLKTVSTFIDTVTTEKEPVLVHCYSGNDRTGAMLACFLVFNGFSPEKAIAEIKKVNPTAMTTHGYEKAVHMYAEKKG